MDYFSEKWQNLSWSPWIPFDADIPTFKQLPAEPGLYRIRPQGEDFLMYIGQTGRTVRQRLNELRQNVKKEEMPFNDPHTAAPSLWTWNDALGFQYECSAAPLVCSKPDRMAVECYLLWQYRIEFGSSTLCNFGRFHREYVKSRGRCSGIRGERLPDGEQNPAGGRSCPPLQPTGRAGEPGWMGIEWSELLPLVSSSLRDVPDSSGVYLLFDASAGDLIYIGESSTCKKRLKTHAWLHRERPGIDFSYHTLNGDIRPHNRKEIENDLIGCLYHEQGRPPEMQFGYQE